MPETRALTCPNCSAPMTVALGETEIDCEYCDSLVRLIPDSGEMAVVRTREDMKRRERVELAQARMRKELQQEEAEAWRRTAAKVAIAALPVVGRSLGGAAFRVALRHATRPHVRIRPGCGCILPLLLLGAVAIVSATAL